MTRSFSSLERVLTLEAQQGYQDKAVVGGIRQFAAFWVGQAREEAQDEADKALVEQVAEVLTSYGKLHGVDARQKAVDGLLASLERRQKRLADTSTKQEAPRPKQTADRPQKAPPPPKKEVVITSREEEESPEELFDEEAEFDESAEEPVKKSVEESAEESVEEPSIEVEPDIEGLKQPVTILKGVGPKIARKLEKLGAWTIYDLLYLFPRRYDDYTLMKPINRLNYGEQVTVIGTIWQTRAKRIRGNQTLVQAVVNDGTGSVQATWYNQPWLTKQLPAGMQIVLSGKVDQFLGRPVFNSPEWEPLELEPLRTRRIVPIYPLTEGLGSHRMREIMDAAVSYWSMRVPDALPESLRRQLKLYKLPQALKQIHFPDNQESLQKARKRLAFDELFLLQLGMQSQRRQWQSRSAVPVVTQPEQLAEFLDLLPYSLTGAQDRVVKEILSDMAADVPMNRLLQGDVGAGKTVVAAMAMFAVAKNGLQAALMAPTEILAEQHYQGLSQLLVSSGLNLALLTGSTAAGERSEIYEGLADGTIQIVIGTHALIQDAVNYHNLALAVIDEQHRFGVEQRGALREKGIQDGDKANPHLLIMSATPIPRTLALSLFGDLDLSILDEMPPGRQEIKTRWLRASERERAYNFVRREVEEGRQAYLIFPLVEESDKIDAKAAVAEYNVLANEVFPDLQVGLVHGRLKSDEKEAAMRAFYAGDLNILVATSVIEVGVDVPNSTVMVIEGANRFGLAQLHQFRGRVGRGEHQSYCILIADESSGDAEKRLLALEETNDGFLLAEKDLELRGPGEFFGQRQSGLPELRMASLLDLSLLEMAQREASKLFADDPDLSQPENALLQEQLALFWEEASDVS
ncbi:MAG: ATP-dependent DNA helicase RecG [Candidatus Promineifilaceae bacterium]|jgi:ATP-dependent DNA helicase RecG